MKAALERLYAQHSAALGQALRWRFGDGPPDPDDAIQIAFEKYIELGAAARVERPRAFLFAMARNWMIDELRKMGVRQRHAERQKTDPLLVRVEERTAENVLSSKERFSRLNAAIRALPERQRTLIVMSRIEELSYRQIAQETGLSQAGISREIARALTALQAALATDEEE
jgi:RNA polymerase sigma-70 factor (ECF subfamily)